jgi:DNA-binding FadR family transcriptional regulator
MNETAPFAFAEDTARNLHTRLADQIGIRIIRGDTKPGEALPSELRICEMAGISRTAVREAIRVLVGKGLLQSKPKSGTRVREPEHWNHLDPDMLRWRLEVTEVDSYLQKLFELRVAVEPAAAALAATAATAEEVEHLQRAVDRMASARTDEAFADADIDFHKGLYFATGNEFFWPIAQMLSLALRKSFRIAAKGDHRKRALAEHQEIVDAVAARDPERARAATLKLLGNAASDLAAIRGKAKQRERRA